MNLQYSRVMYLCMLMIVAGANLAQNHLGAWSVPAAETPGDHTQLGPLGVKVGFLDFGSWRS